MKPFDLEKALADEPVKLRNGAKAYVKYVMPDDYNGVYPLRGVRHSVTSDTMYVDVMWTKEGNVHHSDSVRDLDIIGMWEEPRSRVQLDLPPPLDKVDQGQEVYIIGYTSANGEIKKVTFYKKHTIHKIALENGCLFATKEDAQEWLDAMRNARR